MSGAYVHAIQNSLSGFLNLLIRLSLPLAILFGLGIVALSVTYYIRRDSAEDGIQVLRAGFAKLAGLAFVGLAFVVCWSALSQTRKVTVDALNWKDASEEVANPTEDAPSIDQYGPVAAILEEKTFTRTIALPLEIGQRIEAEGVQVLSQYLPDTSATNVIDQADKLEKKGNGYFLTRQVKRMDETTVPFQNTTVKVAFANKGNRAYQSQFEGRFTFKNPRSEPANLRFTFPVPSSGTMSDLKLTVGDTVVSQPDDQGSFQWSGTVGPGESKTATVTYAAVGSRTWRYNVGSQRRAVEQFKLDAQAPMPLKFLRGSLQPSNSGSNPSWQLSNVVTSQAVAISFPSDKVGRETFVQTMAMLPAALALFLVGCWLISWRTGAWPETTVFAVGIFLFAFGLGGSSIFAQYLGSVAGVGLSLAIGCGAVALAMGKKYLLAALPAALFAAAFLSPEHTGLIVAIVVAAWLATLVGLKSKFNGT
ncbi:MAG TPA: hypothetical protein VJ835_06750 [Fimbriimonadaceae bacterium]|nr:hypothetical protein [Fimbriimonadaceae bacterium]